MFADEDAVTAKYEGMGHRDVEILECGPQRQDAARPLVRVVDVDLPGFAKQGAQADQHHAPDRRVEAGAEGVWNGTFEVEVEGAPIQLSGVMRLVPDEDACTHEVTITMNVKVPLVGGKIADWAGKNDVAPHPRRRVRRRRHLAGRPPGLIRRAN